MAAKLLRARIDPATGVSSKDVTIDPVNNVRARLFLPPLDTKTKFPILVYFHGGAFVQGSAFDETNTNFLNALVSNTNVLAVSVDYRLAPIHALPAAYDDAVASQEWVFSTNADEWITEYGDLDHVFVSGDSAGANISHRLALLLKEKGLATVEGVALLCPYFWGRKPIKNETRNGAVRAGVEFNWNTAGVQLDHPWADPLMPRAPSLAGLACKRVFVCVAEKDMLVWRGKAYYEGLKGSGWGGEEAEVKEYMGVDHDWFKNDLECQQTKELMAKLNAFFNKNV